jgi:SRSO17 transposase
MHDAALGAGQADVSQTRSSLLRTRVKDVLTRAVLETYHRLVQDEMGEPDGVLLIDETGFAKKGQDSVGVARQYCGILGKVENCQVGVFAAYASRQGYALVDKRLFLPEPWFSGAYTARRTKCKVPAVHTGAFATPICKS